MAAAQKNSIGSTIRSAAVATLCALLIAGLSVPASLAQTPAAPAGNLAAEGPATHAEPTAQPGNLSDEIADDPVGSPLVEKYPDQPDVAPVEVDQAPQPEPRPATLSRSEEIDQFEAQLSRFAVTEDDARDLFNHYRDETRLRLWQFAMALSAASSTADRVTIDPAKLEEQHPGFPKQAYQLPVDVVTLRDLYNDTLDAFWARNRMLELVSPELREQAVGSALYGMQELRSERDLIIAEVRYQVLRLPQAAWQIKRMAVQAPVPLIWIIVEFWLAIFLFRWWRRWVPATLQRMRTSLLSIRPRTDEILTRLRGLWYINQVRTPLEWLLLWTFLFSLMQFDGLDFVRDVGLIVVRWLMFTWFAVALLNAYVARGAGGMAGESALLRLKSMRLVAGWLLLLGLGLDLSNDLVGNAALTSWIWRIFQLLIFPLVFSLLSIWHMELYTRLEREGEPAVPRAEYTQQRGLRRWVGSAKVAGLLLASWLRAVLIRRIERFGSMRAAAGLSVQEDSIEQVPETARLPAATRQILIKGHDEFSKYARLERRALVDRINADKGGVVGIVGERGIGKNGFLRQVADAHNHGTLFIECRAGSAVEIVAEFGRQLELDIARVSDAELNAALEARDIRFIAIFDLHLLVRPVIGGFSELAGLSSLFARVQVPLVWGISVDRYAYQFIARARDDYQLVDSMVQLRPWTEDQIGEFVEQRCESAGLQPDFSKIRVPRQYMDVAQDAIEDRNRVGLYTMLSAMSRGNPAIAIRLFADCIRMTADGVAEVSLPANRDDQVFSQQPINSLLVLRVIAQVELITYDDIVSNLRLAPAVVTSALQMARLHGWVEEHNGQYRISLSWFRVITQTLGRQNLLAGVRQEIA